MESRFDRLFLAIDLGTSGAKAALVDIEGRIRKWAFRAVDLKLLPGGGAEQDPRQWWAAADESIRAVLPDSAAGRAAIAAISTSAMGEETVAVGRNGEPLADAMLWMDSRGKDEIVKAVSGVPNISGYGLRRIIPWLSLTGGAPSRSGKDPAGHILYIKNRHPEIYEKTWKFLNSLDYINMKLSGEICATRDSVLPLWVTDNRRAADVRYSPLLLKQLGFDREKLPDIVGGCDIIGRLRPPLADKWGLGSDVRIVAGSVDITASAVGAGSLFDKRSNLCLGTSSYLSTHIDCKKTDLRTSIASFPSAIDGQYLIMNNQTVAAGNLSFLKDRILYHKDELLIESGREDVYKIFDDICRKIPAGSNGLIYMPWLYGERTPCENAEVRGGIFNLSLENNREDIIKAVYEGVAFNSRWMTEGAEKLYGRKMERIMLAGGGGQSDIWCQIHADVTGRIIEQDHNPRQINSRGAAFIAAIGTGDLKAEDIPGLVKVKKTYYPRKAEQETYGRIFPIFLKLFKEGAKLNAAYNRALSLR